LWGGNGEQEKENGPAPRFEMTKIEKEKRPGDDAGPFRFQDES
jgi:hypothetical protein